MAELNINGRMLVKNLKKQFKEAFGASLRVYNGKELADDDARLASIRTGDAKGGDLSVRGNMKVGGFEKKMLEIYGISVQVADAADTQLVPDDVTIASLNGKTGSGATENSDVSVPYNPIQQNGSEPKTNNEEILKLKAEIAEKDAALSQMQTELEKVRTELTSLKEQYSTQSQLNESLKSQIEILKQKAQEVPAPIVEKVAKPKEEEPESADDVRYKAEEFADMGDYSKAISYLKKYLASFGEEDREHLFYDMSEYAEKNGKIDEAIKYSVMGKCRSRTYKLVAKRAKVLVEARSYVAAKKLVMKYANDMSSYNSENLLRKIDNAKRYNSTYISIL